MLYDYFSRGINIGGYLSQFEIITESNEKDVLDKHFSTFITEYNIKQIADWGFDHIRIPVDGKYFWDMDKGEMNLSVFEYLDRCIEYCSDCGINVIIDLHDFYGHEFGSMSEPTQLMLDDNIRRGFVDFWTYMAKHFKNYNGCVIMFEIFNEMADSTEYKWNELYMSVIEAIRKIDKDRYILVGSNFVNCISYLSKLSIVDDDKVFYNFHYYEPNAFTHQKAHFSEEFRKFSKTMHYPDEMSEYIGFLDLNLEYKMEHPLINNTTKTNDSTLMKDFMEYAKDFMDTTGKELMCTEYGVIDTALEDDAVKWIKDFDDICDKLNIGHTMWNYKCLDFELIDIYNHVTRGKLLNSIIVMNKR